MARGHVARVATVRAISIKYSSQPGRMSKVFAGPRKTPYEGSSAGRTAAGTELTLPNMRSPASPKPGTM